MTEQPSQQPGAQQPEVQQPGPQQAEAPVEQGLGEHATGDIVIDSALQDLRNAPHEDLDAQIEAGRRVQDTLQARLGDLGGE